MNKLTRVAIYRRVSHELQARDGDSLDAQLNILKEFAKANNYLIVGQYDDFGISGQKTKSRDGYQKLMKDVKEGKIDLIIFTKLDRWFRSLKEYLNTQEILDKYNVKWKAILEHHDTSTAAGEAFVNILMAFAQLEAKQTGERIKTVFDRKIEKGEVISGTTPFGYKINNKKLVIDEDKKEVVLHVYDTFLKIGSIRGTVTELKLEGYKFNVDAVRNILSKPQYVGKYNFRGRVNDNYCPSIIDINIYEEVQELLKMNDKLYSKTDKIQPYTYIFRKLILCPECGHVMTATKYKFSGGYRYGYRCPYHRDRGTCSFKTVIYEHELEPYLIANVRSQLEDIKISFEQAGVVKVKDNSSLIEKLKNRMSKLKDLYLDDLIDKVEYAYEYNSLSKQVQDLSRIKNDKSFNDNKTKSINHILSLNFEELYSSFTNIEKRRLWLSIIDKITIDENKNISIEYK